MVKISEVEICVNSADTEAVQQAVSQAYIGGASRIELCRDMHLGGLTPPAEHIRAARNVFRDRNGLMVMVRPRPGDFFYSANEIDLMKRQIEMAAQNGADGVVLGLLKDTDLQIDKTALESLVRLSKDHGLKTTFHRAFDAAHDPIEALEIMVDCGVDRLLTSGTPWGSDKSAIDGVSQIAKLVKQASGRIEIVIGGGVNSGNIPTILNKIPKTDGKISVHAYSGAMIDGKTSSQAVKALVQAVRNVCMDS